MKKILIIFLMLIMVISPSAAYANKSISSEKIEGEWETKDSTTDNIEVNVEDDSFIDTKTKTDIEVESSNQEETKADSVLESVEKEQGEDTVHTQNMQENETTPEDKSPNSADEWLEYAQSQETSTLRLTYYMEGLNLYPEDERFKTGINTSAISLLKWATDQHQSLKYDAAIGRYEFILSASELDNMVRKETETKLKYAEQNYTIPTANQLVDLAKRQASSSPRLEKYIEGYYLFSKDSRFTLGINRNAQSLYNWAVEQHHEGRYNVAIGRYEYLLTTPTLTEKFREGVKNKLNDAGNNKRPADIIYEKAINQTTSTMKLTLYKEGNHFYPNDNRFLDGINSSARSLITWARQQHQNESYEVASGRYEFVLSASKLEMNIRKLTETLLRYSAQESKVPTADQMVNLATNESTSSPRLERFIEGYWLYPGDPRFETGVNRNARSLLNWALEQHREGDFDVAIGRYEFILSSPVLRKDIVEETTMKLSYAKDNIIIPSVDEIVELAEKEPSSSPRLERLIEGYRLYPGNKRLKEKINSTARSVLNWAISKHHDAEYDIAIGRYDFILTAPVLDNVLIQQTKNQLNDAKIGKRPANVIYEDARKKTASSKRLQLYKEGYKHYPSDSRFRKGINTSAKSLLKWATSQHQIEDFDTAVYRYYMILSAPTLEQPLKQETEIKLAYAEAGKKVPSANQIIEIAKAQSTLSATFNLYLEGYVLYPKDTRFREGIAVSARNLFIWAETQHLKGEYEVARDRYQKVIDAPSVPYTLKNLARHHITYAIKGKSFASNTKVVNPKVQNYTFAQMEKDINALEKMYPHLVKKVIIGKSLDGRNLYAVRLGSGETEVLFNASAHAREHMTTSVIMNMLDEYAFAYVRGNNYGGFNLREVLDRTSIWFVPMNNPDGVTLVQQGPDALSGTLAKNAIHINGGSKNFTSWKANARGVDLNRNYPSLWKTVTNNPGRPSESHYKGPMPLSEPETQAMYNFILSRNFKTLVDYHSSGEVLYARLPGHIERIVSQKTGYRIIDETFFTSGGDLPTWFTLELGMPGLTPEISPYVGNRPVPVSNWDSIWVKNGSVGLMVADEAYRNRK
ncbi:M14 family zinc carboxypeptidase [Sutcliffiella horikoshii]|uniref:M14 family zinc carboxypeptidase n=1 Tax=Sutcliffiella horikoshii TaxID=79883 RepID=UPI003CEAEC20